MVDNKKKKQDFTRDGFVTPYEFSLFLRWFGPLKKSITFLCETINFGFVFILYLFISSN